MNEYHDKPLVGMTAQELVDHLYHLGSIECLQSSDDEDDYYEAVNEVKQEVMKRFIK